MTAKQIRTQYLLLGAAGLTLALVMAILQTGPGYMDAEYYTAGAINLTNGNGFWEPYIWNYLDNPQSLPHPAFTYWMPLPALLAALGMFLTGNQSFLSARIIYILFYGLLPIFVFWLSRNYLKSPQYAWIPAVLSLFPGLYSIYFTLPESFLLYLLGGTAFMLVAFLAKWKWLRSDMGWPRALLVGGIAGIMHLTRADGWLWLGAGIFWVIWGSLQQNKTYKLRVAIKLFAVVIFGYSMAMGPWFWRNLNYYGTIMPPGGLQTIWLTNYDQTFSYPASNISISQWISEGLSTHFNNWGNALWANSLNLFVFQGGIILLPLMIAGIWRLRHERWVQFMSGMWLLTFLTMTFVFPFSGPRGGYIHSASAYQVFGWLMVIPGLESFALFLKRKRHLPISQSITVLGIFGILMMVGITIWGFSTRVVGPDRKNSKWTANEKAMQGVADYLEENGATLQDVVMVNDPPGFYLASQMRSIVIPYGPLETAVAAAQQFNASYLLIDENQTNLVDVYMHPSDWPGIRYIETVNDYQIYKVEP